MWWCRFVSRDEVERGGVWSVFLLCFFVVFCSYLVLSELEVEDGVPISAFGRSCGFRQDFQVFAG